MKRQNWVLIIESEEHATELKRMSLNLGFQVLCCAQSSHALWYLQNQKFALVVVGRNIRKPAFLPTIQNNNRHINRDTPVVILNEDIHAHFADKVRSVFSNFNNDR